jgi:hypothetical protein
MGKSESFWRLFSIKKKLILKFDFFKIQVHLKGSKHQKRKEKLKRDEKLKLLKQQKANLGQTSSESSSPVEVTAKQ